MRPSSATMTTMTPNQIGSKPRFVTIGKKIGTVSRTIASVSTKHPSRRYRRSSSR